jgi:siderophore synthetase component
VELTVNVSVEELARVIGTQKLVDIRELIKLLIADLSDEQMTWLVIAECLESLRAQYAEEADWYTKRELKETFENPEYESPLHYDQIRTEALTYQSATEHVLNHVRDVLAGKPERVG